MRLDSKRFKWINRPLSLLSAVALFMAAVTPSWVFAQAGNESWSEPVNLSHTGFAANPAFVIDSEGIAHVLWQDALEDYIYTRFDGDQWSTPKATDLKRIFPLPIVGVLSGPTQVHIYNGPNPLFLAGADQDIYALWISPEGTLLRSKVKSPSFDSARAWESVRTLAPEAVSFAAAVDAEGELHVVYIRMVGDLANPPGIYYIRSTVSGSNWSRPVLLYQSPYLRTLGENEANLSIATAGTTDALHVYVAWDNRPRKQVLLAQSPDGGANWEEPLLVAGPAPDSGLAGPFNIRVGTLNSSVVLLWQSGQPEAGCSQIYKFSTDAGITWSDPQPMIEELSGCAQSHEFVIAGPEGPLYSLTETKSKVLLTAWDGSQWSQPQEQPMLAGFEEPEIFTQVIFGCHRAAFFGGRLYVVGCDTGQGGDVWVTSRELNSDTSSFEAPLWSQLSPVTNDISQVEAVELVTTDDNLFHAFFSQRQDSAIYYTNWDGQLWSRTTPVLQMPDGEAGAPAVAVGPANELFLIAPNKIGALYFNRAISGGAVIASSWSTPTKLASVHDGEIGSADVTFDSAGMLYVAYSVPVNDERGIYVVLSRDQGATWSQPLQVFDGAAAGFDFVGAPSLLASSDGLLHIIWKVQSVQGDGVPQPLSLFYARSEDGGQSFGDPQLIVDEPVAWREIVSDGEGNLHLLWQPQDTITVWDQVSVDDGHTWNYPQGLPDAGRLAAVTKDAAGRLHLFGAGQSALGHWLWDGGSWQAETSPSWTLGSQQQRPVEWLISAVNNQGKMMVVLAKPVDSGNAADLTLLYSTRTVQLPTAQTGTQTVATPTLAVPTSSPDAGTPDAAPTLTAIVGSVPTSSAPPTNQVQTSDQLSPFRTALLPVALLLLSVLGIGLWRAMRAKNR